MYSFVLIKHSQFMDKNNIDPHCTKMKENGQPSNSSLICFVESRGQTFLLENWATN